MEIQMTRSEMEYIMDLITNKHQYSSEDEIIWEKIWKQFERQDKGGYADE